MTQFNSNKEKLLLEIKEIIFETRTMKKFNYWTIFYNLEEDVKTCNCEKNLEHFQASFYNWCDLMDEPLDSEDEIYVEHDSDAETDVDYP